MFLTSALFAKAMMHDYTGISSQVSWAQAQATPTSRLSFYLRSCLSIESYERIHSNAFLPESGPSSKL